MQSQWTLQDAKNKFSEVVNAACSGSPQVVTKRGTPSVVVLSMTSYEKLIEQSKAPVPCFTDFLLSMPSSCSDEDSSPRKDTALREVEF